MIFDTHAHYDDPAFDADRDELLSGLNGNGIGTVVDVCADIDDVEKVLTLAKRYPGVYASVGVHPSNVTVLDEEKMASLKEACADPRVVAVGEIGLDYHYRLEEDPSETDPPRDVQKKWFERQLTLAQETGLPVIIHSRDASADTLDIMRGAHSRGITGVIHCYSGSVETAKEYLKMGYFLGIGGVVTFKNGRVLREVVKESPIEQLVLETDCPYLAPEPHRGRRNDSRYLPLVVSAIAQIKGISEDEVVRITEENARRLYSMQEMR